MASALFCCFGNSFPDATDRQKAGIADIGSSKMVCWQTDRQGGVPMVQMLFMMLQECLFFLGYVTGKSEFPQPLSRTEEAECIQRMEQGDERARQELITHNLRLVSHIARKYQVPGYGQDDLISIGVIGLIKSVNSFKASAGTSLGTYAARCIENAIPSPQRQTGCGGRCGGCRRAAG
jgi:hypothetical protein